MIRLLKDDQMTTVNLKKVFPNLYAAFFSKIFG